MAETHFEPFLHLADVGPDRALVTWGGFWFHREHADARWDIVDDEQLGEVDPGRTESIGARSTPYGDAMVEVFDDVRCAGRLGAHRRAQPRLGHRAAAQHRLPVPRHRRPRGVGRR